MPRMRELQAESSRRKNPANAARPHAPPPPPGRQRHEAPRSDLEQPLPHLRHPRGYAREIVREFGPKARDGSVPAPHVECGDATCTLHGSGGGCGERSVSRGGWGGAGSKGPGRSRGRGSALAENDLLAISATGGSIRSGKRNVFRALATRRRRRSRAVTARAHKRSGPLARLRLKRPAGERPRSRPRRFRGCGTGLSSEDRADLIDQARSV
jgi:hypothetical protein